MLPSIGRVGCLLYRFPARAGKNTGKQLSALQSRVPENNSCLVCQVQAEQLLARLRARDRWLLASQDDPLICAVARPTSMCSFRHSQASSRACVSMCAGFPSGGSCAAASFPPRVRRRRANMVAAEMAKMWRGGETGGSGERGEGEGGLETSDAVSSFAWTSHLPSLPFGSGAFFWPDHSRELRRRTEVMSYVSWGRLRFWARRRLGRSPLCGGRAPCAFGWGVVDGKQGRLVVSEWLLEGS